MLCAPKADVTMEAKKKYHPDPLPVKTAIQLQRHKGFWKKKNRSKKKKISPTSNRALKCHDKTNSTESALFGALSTWANEAAVRNDCVIVTSSFSETKGFFCFRLTIDLFGGTSDRRKYVCVCRLPLGKLRVVCIRNISKTKSKSAKKNTGWCFSTEVEATCKNSASLGQETKTTKIVTYPLLSLASSSNT